MLLSRAGLRAHIKATGVRLGSVPVPLFATVPTRFHGSHRGGLDFHHRLPESSTPQNARVINSVIGAGAFSDLVLVGIKGAAGIVTGSSALISDSIHSISDVLISLLSGVTARFASRSPDKEHPFGHGRLDSLGALAVSTLLVATGGTIGVRAFQEVSSIMQGKAPEPMVSSFLAHAHGVAADAAASMPTELLLSDPTFAGIAIAACLGSVGIKEFCYRWTMRVGLQMRSNALIANAWHHRADSLSSGVAAVGIGGAFLGFPAADPLAAMAVAAMIAKAGASTGITAVRELMDERMDEEVIKEAVDVIRGHRDVVGLRRIRSRRSGPAVLMDCEVAVAPDITVGGADELAKSIRGQLFRERREVSELLIHFVPADEHDSMASTDLREQKAHDGAETEEGSHEGGNTESAHSHGAADASGPASSTSASSSPSPSVPVLPRYSIEELKEQVREAILSPSGSGFRTLTSLDVHAESASSRLLHVHASVVPADMGAPTREALAAVRRTQARLKALELPVHKPTSSSSGAGSSNAAVWKVAIADVQLDCNPL